MSAGTTTQGFAQANLPFFLFNSNPHVTTVAYQAKIYPQSLSETEGEKRRNKSLMG